MPSDEFSLRYSDLVTGSYDCVYRIVLNAFFPLGHQRISGSRTEIVPKAGHMPQVEQREATHALVEEFLGHHHEKSRRTAPAKTSHVRDAQ